MHTLVLCVSENNNNNKKAISERESNFLVLTFRIVVVEQIIRSWKKR